jgi:hypothetical protein
MGDALHNRAARIDAARRRLHETIHDGMRGLVVGSEESCRAWIAEARHKAARIGLILRNASDWPEVEEAILLAAEIAGGRRALTPDAGEALTPGPSPEGEGGGGIDWRAQYGLMRARAAEALLLVNSEDSLDVGDTCPTCGGIGATGPDRASAPRCADCGGTRCPAAWTTPSPDGDDPSLDDLDEIADAARYDEPGEEE